MTEVDVYQEQITIRLREILREHQYDLPVESPWAAFTGERRGIYAPKLDIAVGPFAAQNQYINEYDSLVHTFGRLIDKWVEMFLENCSGFQRQNWQGSPSTPANYLSFIDANSNARCFIAIEIENETTRKHLMGSIINAGALGRIGILVAWQDKVLRAAIRMRRYFDFLREAQKRTFDMSGVIVLTKEQLASSLFIQI